MELYDRRQVKKYAARVRCWVIFAVVAAAAALAACVFCCCSVTTATAAVWEQRGILISTLGGWFVIFALTMCIFPNLHAKQHEQNMLSGEEVTQTGVVSVEPQVLQIPKSITICKVVLKTPEETRRLSIRSDKLKLLMPYEGREMTLRTVKGYIVGWEELQ